MPSQSAKVIRWSGGTINRIDKTGKYSAYIRIDGIRHRARTVTLVEAKAWLEQTASGEALSGRPLTRVQMADARRALEMLPLGMTLSNLAEQFTRARGRVQTVTGIKLSEALERFLEDRRISVAVNTLDLYRNTVRRLIASIEDIPVAACTRLHIIDLVKPMEATTRNNYIRNLGIFFSWCLSNELTQDNPALSVPKAKASEPPKGVLSVEEGRALLTTSLSVDAELVPYFALGMFAGVRPAETQRMTASNIGAEYITLDGAITKTADHRTVKIRPNLRAWLEAAPPWAPPESRNVLVKRVQAVVKTAGITWKHDCLRHSFASYAYELTKNAAAVAADMGHHGTDIFFRHYRALSHPGDGEKWFAIHPESIFS